MLASRQGLGTETGGQQSGGHCAELVCLSQASSRGGPPYRAQSPLSCKNKMPACLSQERDLSRGEGGLI